MNDVTAGILMLLLIVVVMFASRQLRMMRLKKWVEAARRATDEKRFEEAEKALRRCLKLAPMWTPARTGLGWVLGQQDKLGEAEEQIKMAAELHPKEAAGHFNLALFYLSFFPDRREDALAALQQGATAAENGDWRDILDDPRWAPLRDEPAFQELLR
jgi:Flp pilus assembly protein TadD